MAWARNDLNTSTDPAHLLSAAMRLHEGEAGFPPVPSVNSIVVAKIVIIHNPQLWARYDAARQALGLRRQEISDKIDSLRGLLATGAFVGQSLFNGFPVIDGGLGETLLFHGTDATRFIVESNIDPSRGKNKGTNAAPNYGLLGQGAYFSDRIAKSATYTLCRICRGFQCNCTTKAGTPVLRVTLMARVLLGRVHNAPTGSVVWDRGRLRSQAFNSPIENASDSIMAAGTGLKRAAGSNEFAVRNIDQIYPEFIVYWHHPPPLAPSMELWDNASRVGMAQRHQRRLNQQPALAQTLLDLEEQQLGLHIAQLFA